MKLLLSLLFLSAPVMAGAQKPSGKPANKPAPPPAAVATTPAAPQGDPLDATVKARIEAFFRSVQERRVQDGFNKLFEGSTIAAGETKMLETLTHNTLLLLEKCGKMESASVVRVRSVGTTLREVTCIMNCEKRPMRWTMYVYKGEGRWQVLDAEVDLELHRFFESDKNEAD